MTAEANAILSFQGKDDGLQKILKSASEGFTGLADSVGQGKNNLADLRDESGLFEKTFKTLTGSVKRGQDSFDKLGDSASAIGDGFTTSAKITDVTSKGFVKFAASALGLGKQVSFVNTVLGPMGDLWHDVDDAQSAVGKGFAVLNAASKPLITGLRSASEFTAELAEKMGGLGEAGKATAGVMLAVSKTLGTFASGVKVADIAGDVYQLVEAVKEFSEEQLPELIEQTKSAYEMFEKAGLKAALFGDTLKTLKTTAMVLQATTKGVTKEVSGMFLQFVQFKETIQTIKGYASVLYDSYLRMKGLSEATSAFQSMGLDTTMAELAVKVGAFGEGLLANAEAAKQFVNTTVTAFAQVQDQIGYLQTLSTAAAESQSTLFNSFKGLTQGPLKNAITTADAAKASYFAMSAGADTLSKSNLLMTATAKGAVAGQVDQSQAINAVSNAMAPYKKNFRDADKVMGQFFATTEAGQLDLGNLTGAIGELSSAGATVNIATEQILGMYATLTKVGPPGEAATRLSNLLQDVTSVSSTAQDELDRLGIRLDKYAIQQKGLLPILKEIFSKTSVEQQRKIFANDYSFQAAQGLISNLEDANKITESISKSGASTLDEMFNKRRATLMQQGTALMNGFKDVMADLGQRVLPLLEPGIKFLNQMLEYFQQMPEWQKNVIANIAMGTIAMQKASDVGGSLGGILMNLAKTYLMARAMSLFWSGQLLNEAGIIKELIVRHKDYGGALLRLFGIQQQAASVATTVIAAQEEVTKAMALGKQAEELRTKATQAQTIATSHQQQAELLRIQALALSREADIAAAGATQLKAEADAVGGANARLNTDAQLAEANATKIRTIADEAGVKAKEAQVLADAKAIEATKASTAAQNAAHNLDLANKNASIRANQAVAATEAEAIKLEQAAVASRASATAATTTAVELERIAVEKAAIAQAAKSAADQAGGTNALLNAKAVHLQKEAAIAQAAATNAATKSIELSSAASKAEIASTNASIVATNAKAEAETAAAFATARNTEAKAENVAVDLADDKAATTIDLATGAVQTNTAATTANTQAKAVNTATSLADDDSVQTLEVVNGVVQTNTTNVGANTGAKVSNAATTVTATNAQAANTVTTEVNSSATVVNTQARGLLGKINGFLTAQINLSSLAILRNNITMASGAGIMGIASLATKGFAVAMGIARGALMAFWVSLGPITLALIALYVTFNVFKDLAESIGLVGSEFSEMAKSAKEADKELDDFRKSLGKTEEKVSEVQKTNEGWFHSILDWFGLIRNQTKEYTGFINTQLYPALNMIANVFTLGMQKERFNGFFEKLKEINESARQEQARRAYEVADQKTQDLLIETKRMQWASAKGKLIGAETQKLITEARASADKSGQAALEGESFQKILDANRKAAEEQTKINDKRVEQLTAQINSPKITKARKEQLQVQIDALKAESSALDEVTKKQEKYLQNIQGIAQVVDENNASLSTEKTISNLRKQQYDLLKDTEKLPTSIRDGYVSVFESLEKGMNNTGIMQRRMNNQLILAVKNFEDNVKEAKDITKVEDLAKMRQDADVLREKILASFKQGSISQELAQTLMGELKNQEIEVDTPNFKFKGKILTAEQEQALIQAETEINQEVVDRRVSKIQQGIEDINSAEAQGLLLSGEAQSKRLAKQIEIDKERLDNAKKTEELMLNYGKDSPQYIKAVQDRRAVERQIEKTSYDKQLAEDNYFTERRVKLREQAIARIKTLEETQRLTAGQSQIETLKEEQRIGEEQAALIRKRMSRMKDTTSDAYKELQMQLEQLERNGESKRFQEQKARQDYTLDRRVKIHEDAIAKINLAEKTLTKTQGESQQETLRQEIAIANERLKLSRTRLQEVGRSAGTGSDVYKDQLREVETLEREVETKRFQEQRAREDYSLERRVKTRQDAIAQIQAAEATLLKTQGQAQQETLRQEISISQERIKLARTRLEDIRQRAGEGSDAYKDQLREVEALERESETKRFQEQKAREDYSLERRLKIHQNTIAQIQLAEATLLKTQGQAQQETLRQEITITQERMKLARTRLEDIRQRAGAGSDTYKDQLLEVNNLEREIETKRFQEQKAREDYSLERRLKIHQNTIAQIQAAEATLLKTQGQAQQETLQQEITIAQERMKLARTRLEDIRQRAGAGSDTYKDQLLEVNNLEREIETKRFQEQKARQDYSLERRLKIHQNTIAQIQAAEATLLKTQGQAQQANLQQEITIAQERMKLARARLEDIRQRAGEGSDTYKDQLLEVNNLEREIETKRFQEQKARQDYSLERRVKVHQNTIAQIQLAEATLLKTQGQSQQEILRQEITISQERMKLARARLEDIRQRAGAGSDTYQDQLLEVNNLEREIETKRFQEQRARQEYALDLRVKIHESAIAQIQVAEATLLKTQGQAQQETLRQELAINQERTQLARTRLEDIRQRAGENSDAYKNQLREVETLEREATVKRFQEQRAREDYALDRRVKIHESAIADIQLSETLLQRTQFEASQATLREEIATNRERQELARQRLEDIRQRAGEESDVFKDQQRELRTLEREQLAKASQLQTAATVNQIEVQQQRIANLVEAQTQAYKAQTNQIDLITAQLQLQQEISESRNSLIQTATDGIAQQLESAGKLINDERLSAQLQVTTAQARLAALASSQKIEQENLKRQEEQKKLALDRQKIDLASAKLANQRAIQDEKLNFRKLQATQKLTDEQVQQHNLALSNLTQQDDLLDGQEANLNNQISAQTELNANAREEMQIRQQQAKDGGIMDVLLAKQSAMVAQVEKEIEILQKQSDFQKSRVDAYTSSLSILSQTTNSERKQKDIAAAIAAIKLNSLNQQQEMERKVLEMQLRQKEAVLEQEKSRVRIMDAENKARIAEAKERVSLAIEEGKSTEQINARLEALKGYLEAGAAIKSTGFALEERGKFEKQMAQLEKDQQAQQFVNQRQQGVMDLAQNLSTGRQRDLKRFLQGDILNQLGTGMGDIQQMGRNTAATVMAAGYDQRRTAFAAAPTLEVPKQVDYESIRKNFLSQLDEFVVPVVSAVAAATKEKTGSQQNIDIERQRLELARIAKERTNLTPQDIPKPVNYQALHQTINSTIKKQAQLLGLSERAIAQPQKDNATQVMRQELKELVGELREQKTRNASSFSQSNTFNVNLPIGSTGDQAKALEEPLINLQMDLWQQVRKELEKGN